MTKSSILTICLLFTITALSACTPWYTKYGIQEGADMKTPENTAKLIEIMRTDLGWDSYRAAELLVTAEPGVTAPYMAEMFEALSMFCVFTPKMATSVSPDDNAADAEPKTRQSDYSSTGSITDNSCPILARAANQHGPGATPHIAKLNTFAAIKTLGALGNDGRAAAHTVIAALGSPHALLREEAADALLKIAYPSNEILKALEVTATADADPKVREAAERSHRTLSALALANPVPEQSPSTPAPTGGNNNSDPNRAGVAAPNDFAIIIGIEKYRGTLPPSTAALADATMFANIAETTLGVPRRNIILLTDDGATKSSLDSYIEDWLPKNIKSDSRVYFFFAGHGAPDPQTGKGYLVPWDGDPRFIERQGIGVDNVAQKLQALGARQVVMMVDACFSGSGGRSVLAPGTRPLVPVKEFEPAPKSTQFAMIAAAGSNETTGTTQDGSHGLFSHFLFEALRGKADADNNNRLTLNEIIQFVGTNVPNEARRDNREQTPRYLLSSDAVGELEVITFK